MILHSFQVGDRVRWSTGSGPWHHRNYYGTVCRVTPKGTVFAIEDEDTPKQEIEFRRGSGLTHLTPREIARRDWEAARPPQRLGVTVSLGCRFEDPHRLHIETAHATAAHARLLAKHLLVVADWLEAEPKENT